MKKKLNQWNSPISPEQVVQGMNAASLNARRLVDDAKIMLDNKRYASSAALSILAIEEAGKLSILRSMTMAKSDQDWKETWKDYRTHTRKNALWKFFDLFRQGVRKLDDFRSLVDGSSDHTYKLDNFKQISIYTDCLSDAKWSIPTDFVDENDAIALHFIANLMCPKKETTETEILLWIKHMGPVWKLDKSAMDKAFVSWHADMQEHGLLDPGPNKAEAFILGMPFDDERA